MDEDYRFQSGRQLADPMYVRKQVETLTEQTKHLGALAQKVTLATAEPLKTGVAEAFNHTA
jgi:hypothetical protein